MEITEASLKIVKETEDSDDAFDKSISLLDSFLSM